MKFKACSAAQVMSAQWYDANISLPGCDKNSEYWPSALL